MKKGQQRRATYQDLVALPEHLNGEIIDGELFVSPRPAGAHTFASSSLGYDLIGPFQRGKEGPGGWWIVDEPELHFADDVLIPDLAGWRTERMAVYPNAPHLTLAPDWVCEVLSPSTAVLDRKLKLKVYAREGVGHAWLIEPQLKTLEVLRLEDKGWRVVDTFAGADRVRAEPFDAVELDLGPLWLPEVHAPGP
ncbi:MAG: Uma2 family endonuclease [Myxococcaceae bacterium]